MAKYRIGWVNIFTNYGGYGDWHESNDKEMLNNWIKYMDEKYKGEVNHWLEESN
jgi:hypothetical protein